MTTFAIRAPSTSRFNYDMDHPFGYQFYDARDDPAPAPDAPATGEPLLDEFEMNTSNQFFDFFKNDNNFMEDPKLIESLATINHEPLPNFHGATSSYGHSDLQNINAVQPYDFLGFLQPQTQPQPQLHTPRYALSTLRPPSQPVMPPPELQAEFLASQLRASSVKTAHQADTSMLGVCGVSGSHPDMDRSLSLNLQLTSPVLDMDLPNATFSIADVLAGMHEDKPRPSSRAKRLTLGFGSDSDFGGRHYAPPMNSEDPRAVERKHMSIIHDSIEELRQTPSPRIPNERRLDDDAESSQTLSTNAGPQPRVDGDVDAGPGVNIGGRKRRKIKEEESGSEAGSTGRVMTRKKGRACAKGHSFSEPRSAQRRPPTGDSKAPRQNLTEEEKKQNHIKSEQKRRNQIKEGFEDLMELMPDAGVAGTSKCTILAKAVDWLSGLIEGNRKLQEQLDMLDPH